MTLVYPVKYRITYNRKQVYIKAGVDLTQSDWEKIDTLRLHEKLSETRELIKNGLKEIEDAMDMILKSGPYTHDKLIRILKKGQTETIRDAHKLRIEELDNTDQIGTASIYHSTLMKINEFEPGTTFSKITVKWLETFERFALKGISPATMSMYIRTLRTLFNWAILESLIPASTYPFSRKQVDGKFIIKQGTGTKTALTLDQLTRFIEYAPPHPAMKRSKDYFILMFYLGGINIKDLLLLTWNNIVSKELIYMQLCSQAYLCHRVQKYRRF